MSIITRLAALTATATLAVAGVASTAHADFGLHDLQVQYASPTGDPSTRAGAATDLHTSFWMNTRIAANGTTVPDEQLKTFALDLPAGFAGNPRAMPRCAPSAFANIVAGGCPVETQVGVATVRLTPEDSSAPNTNVVPVYNIQAGPDEPAVFGFNVVSANVKIAVSTRPGDNDALRAGSTNINQGIPLYGLDLTIWGVPSDPAHDDQRYPAGPFGGPATTPITAPRLPFLTMPTRCGTPLSTTVRANSWQTPGRELTPTVDAPALTGCDTVAFAPTLDVRPTSSRAGAPSGYDVDLTVPQSADPDGQTTAHLEDATVTLPAGTAISPPAADGLQACTDAQLDDASSDPEACPEASRIGTVDIQTPILDRSLQGSIYVAEQRSQDPQSGEMYRLFLTAAGQGVRLKLTGQIKADPRTGQLRASFPDNPQLPFERLSLRFKDGDRSILVNPATCGTKTTTGTLTSWAAQTREVSSSFAIDQGCPQATFSPSFTAGTLSPMAGAFSPFSMTVSREDGDQDLSQIHLDLPSGLLGALGSVPVCAEAQATAGTCAPSTRLGSTTVAVGSGGKPYALAGTVSLAGPYKGAPFSLSIAVPATAGPFDLGMVVVRSPLVIDANRGKVFAPADDLPQIVGGVPLRYRAVNITLDRPSFMWNATSCRPQAIGASFRSVDGAGAAPSVPYQAQGCDRMRLDPSLKMSYGTKSELRKGKHPSLTAELSQSFRQAGLKRVAVTLPLTSSLDAKNAKALCMPEQFAARACPAESIVGRASARTPALHEELTGPVYFLKGQRRTADGGVADTLPKLWLKLEGEGVPLDLIADSTIKGRNLVATFESIPDAPISSFKLQIDGGKNGILGAPRDPCTSDRVATAQFDGQNGGRRIRNVTIAAPECGVRATATASRSRVQLRVVNIGAGRLKVSGKGVKTRTRTLKSGKAATVTASLTTGVRQQVAAGKTVKLRLKVSWTPKGSKKAKTATQTVTVKGAAPGSRRQRTN